MLPNIKDNVLVIEKDLMNDSSRYQHFRRSHQAELRSIKKIILSDGINRIEDLAFINCNDLEEVVFPEGLKEIGSCAFSECRKLKEVVIPEGVAIIEDHAFSGCNSLEAVRLPSTLKIIEAGAFAICEKLSDIELPENIQKLGRAVFNDCRSLRRLRLPSGITEISSGLFENCTALSDLEVEAELKVVHLQSFWCCKNLRYLELADSTTVCRDSFYGCDKLIISQRGKEVPAWIYNNNKAAYFMECPSYEQMLIIPNVTAKTVLSVLFLEDFEGIDKRFKTYVKKNIGKALDYISETEDLRMLDILIEQNIISKRTIDKCLEYVEKNEFHEAFIMLAKYKEEIGGYKKDSRERFDL